MAKWYRYWHVFVLRRWRPYFWLAVAVLFLYAKTLVFRLTNFDDDVLLGENFCMLKHAGNILAAFTRDVFMQSPLQASYYRPLLTLSFMLDARAQGLSLPLFHLTNIALHIAAAGLVFAVLRQFTVSRARAFFLALLFAVHPALSQAVAWIPGRNDSLLAVFILASFYAFNRYLAHQRMGSMLLHFLFFFLAALTKETAFAFIPLFMLYYALFSGENSGGKKILQLLTGWVTILLSWILMRNIVAKMPPQILPGAGFLTTGAVMEKLAVLIQYAGKALFPFNLSGFPVLRDTTLIYGVVAVFVLAGAMLLQREGSRRAAWFGLAWFFIPLLPQFLARESVWLEHRLYVPVVGLLIVFAGVESRRIKRFRRAVAGAGAAIIALFAGITFVHSDIFMNQRSFWESAAISSPHSFWAHGMLGLQYYGFGDYVAAEREIQASLRLAPGYSATHVNYGILLMETARLERAEQEFRASLRCMPGNWVAYYNYGMLFYMEGKGREAEACWRRAIELNPDYKIACKTLAVYRFAAGDKTEARELQERLRQKFGYSLTLSEDIPKRDKKWFYAFGKYL